MLLLWLAGSTAPAAVLVTLSSSSVSLTSGASATLTALVTGCGSNCGVAWSISPAGTGTLGAGNPPDTSGFSVNNYRAPSPITRSQSVTITAKALADATQSDSVTIQLNPTSITVSPSSVTLGAGGTQSFSASGGGGGPYAWSISPQTGSIDQNGNYAAPGIVASAQTVTVTATDQTTNQSGTARISLTATPAVGISISPTSASLTPAATQQFTANVTNASTNAVIWSISPQTGTIDQTGLYTAPAIITASSRVTVTVTSVADGSKSASATVTLNPIVDVGIGAPTPSMQQAFITAFFKNGFNNQVTLPPISNVTRLGTTGYIQTFNGVVSGTKLALATASPSAPPSNDGTTLGIVQLYADLYAYYATVGAGTAGLPLYDTQSCPVIDQTNSCTYDIFDKSYALFAYHAPLATGQNFTVNGVYYTEWTKQGGITGLGRPVDVVTTITASTNTTAGFQSFSNGAVYTLTSGTYRGTTVSVLQPIYGLYSTSGGPASSLGLPIAEEIVLSTGDHRQQFEGGILQYTPGGGGPTQRPPVTTVLLGGAPAGATTITLNLGQSLSLTATPMSSAGQVLSDRAVSWVTTNSRVIAITATGNQAILKAAGAGAASVLAASEGVTSTKLNFIVIAPCCQVGDGSTPAVQQSFQAALTRNKIPVAIPVPSPAQRVGNGYIQMVQSADTGATYMLAESDAVGTAYVVAGALLAAYQATGGPAGTLGYPISDATAGGTQRFENNAALAGNPVRLVSGGVLAKWTSLGSESGTAGAPTADAAAFSTFGANAGNSQTFANGAIYAASSGPRSGQAWFVSGLILARYLALGGAGGDFGMPASDEFITGGVHQQNFEGGNITYSPGDAAAQEHPAPKVPGVVVSPSSVMAGSRARIAIVGFNNNATLNVSVTGQPNFTVTAANGAFSWDMFFPLTALSSTLNIHAADAKSSAVADGTLAVRGFNTNRLPLTKVQGDNQTGLPGSLLPLPLRVALVDSSGNPVTGAAVTFQASSGAQVLTPSALTDANGLAETLVRLAAAEGVALVNANAPSFASAPVTFGVRAAANSLSNFPALQQAGDTPIGNGAATIAQKGALLTSAAMMLRYHQNRGELASPNGYADPAALNQYLTGYCPADANGKTVCDGYLSNPDSGEQVLNLWRAAQFAGGADVEILPPAGAIADLLAQGSPVLVSLGLSLNGTLAGGHYVVATGVASDGSILIQDPNPVFSRAKLNDYLSGFTAAGGTWKADVRGAARFALRSPPERRFLLAAISQAPALVQALSLSIASAAGVCGQTIDLMDAVDATGQTVSKGPLVSRIGACDGAGSVYQLGVGSAQPFRALVSDLAPGGSQFDASGNRPANYQATRPQLNLALSALSASFAAAGVVNAATFAPGIAQGGIISIFGSGLSDPSSPTTVDMDGTALNVLLASPFQINAVVPAAVLPGAHTLTVHSPFGTAQQPVTVVAVSPGIFQVGNPPSGAVTNTSYALIGPANPLPRGQTMIIFATGLGTVTQKGSLFTTDASVTVMLNGSELSSQFAGLAPGFPGLYQVNVAVPSATPPGLGLALALKVGGQVGNSVPVAVQ
ncbi:MAG TPA: Ig-like domain-containing protein [Candidatus Acidoferrales bacterium]|nr:Ig-like domain-containing protein [Candidatus Acidoferrales bacterium]